MYLRTDEESEAANALCMASRFADDLQHDHRMWRWVIIALHSAVQGFMVLSLRRGNSLLALSDRSWKEWMEAYEKGGPFPSEEKLDTYLNLYKKVKSKKVSESCGNRPFDPKGTEGRSIRKLDELRNDFVHFTPKGWSLEIDGLPHICADCLNLIEFLGWETENILWHDLAQKERAFGCLQKLKQQMTTLRKAYAEHAS